MAAAAAVFLVWPASDALAVCTPNAANGVTAICTGATVNQNGTTGYGTGGETGVTVTVVTGASVTGTDFGITLSDGTVINHGTVTGTNFNGVYFDDFGLVINYGSISGATRAIESETKLTVFNYGTVTGGTAGLFADEGLFVVNYGMIRGLGGSGIDADLGRAEVYNSGSIAGSTNGINAGQLLLYNTGTIWGSTNGIRLAPGADFDGATIVNAGVIGGGTAALQFANGDADSLTMLPGSTFIGALNIGGGGDSINFRGGNHNLTFSTLAGATVTSTTPFVVLGDRIAVVDPTPFSSMNNLFTDFSGSISSLLPDFAALGQNSGGPASALAAAPQPAGAEAFAGIPALSMYAPNTAILKSPAIVHPDGTAVWARGFGGRRVQQDLPDGTRLHNVAEYFGGAFGFDRPLGGGVRVGAFLGAGSTRIDVDPRYGGVEGEIAFAGLTARASHGATFYSVTVQGGVSRHSSRRNTNNNLVAGGIETATASFDGWYVSPEAAGGIRIALGRHFGVRHTLTPNLRLRYLYAAFDGYTETGSTANLTAGRRTVENLEERAELRHTATQIVAGGVLQTSLYGGAFATQRVGGTTFGAVLLGQPVSFALPGSDTTWGGFGGAGFERRSGRLALYGTAEYAAMSDESNLVSARGGVRVGF